MADANLCKDGNESTFLRTKRIRHFSKHTSNPVAQCLVATPSTTTTQNNLHPSSYSSYVYVVVAAPGLFHNNMAWPKRQTYLHDNRPRYATTVSIVLFLDEVNWEKHTVTGVSHCVCGTNKVPLQFHSIP